MCVEQIVSRNTQILVGYMLRKTPVVTLERLKSETIGLNFFRESDGFSSYFSKENLFGYHERVMFQLFNILIKKIPPELRDTLTHSAPNISSVIYNVDRLIIYYSSGDFGTPEPYKLDMYGSMRHIYDYDLTAEVARLEKFRDAYLGNPKRYKQVDDLYKKVLDLHSQTLIFRRTATETVTSRFDDFINTDLIPALSALPYVPPPNKAAIMKAFNDLGVIYLNGLKDVAQIWPVSGNYMRRELFMPAMKLDYPIP